MNTINASTGFSPFMLKSAHSPHLIPPLTNVEHTVQEQPATSITPETPNDKDTLNPENDPTTEHINTTPCDTPIPNDMTRTTPNTTTMTPDDIHPPGNTTPTPTSDGKIEAQHIFNQLAEDLIDAQDLLTAAKISQASQANKDRSPNPEFEVGDRVFLATAHRRRDYMQAKDGHVAKFMPRFDGPFKVLKAYPHSSTYTLHLPEYSKIHRTFHSSLLHTCVENDPELFPSRTLEKPGPIITANGEIEYFIDKIINQCTRGRGKQYLVCWLGYGPESDLWLPRHELVDTEAYTEWLQTHDT